MVDMFDIQFIFDFATVTVKKIARKFLMTTFCTATKYFASLSPLTGGRHWRDGRELGSRVETLTAKSVSSRLSLGVTGQGQRGHV